MSKRPPSPKSEIPPAHRHCQRPAAVASPVYNPTTPVYIPTSPGYIPASPVYDPASRIFDPVRKYHPTFDRTDVMSITYDVDDDPLRFAPIKPSKITTWTWPEFPKATRPQPPVPEFDVPEFDDDVECDEVAGLCECA